jgi:hypothetical protein
MPPTKSLQDRIAEWAENKQITKEKDELEQSHKRKAERRVGERFAKADIAVVQRNKWPRKKRSSEEERDFLLSKAFGIKKKPSPQPLIKRHVSIPGSSIDEEVSRFAAANPKLIREAKSKMSKEEKLRNDKVERPSHICGGKTLNGGICHRKVCFGVEHCRFHTLRSNTGIIQPSVRLPVIPGSSITENIANFAKANPELIYNSKAGRTNFYNNIT